MENKLFFLPGDVVTIRQNIPNKPVMLVSKKVTTTLRTNSTRSSMFQGIACTWFTSTGELQTAVFNTKDLIKVNNEQS